MSESVLVPLSLSIVMLVSFVLGVGVFPIVVIVVVSVLGWPIEAGSVWGLSLLVVGFIAVLGCVCVLPLLVVA